MIQLLLVLVAGVALTYSYRRWWVAVRWLLVLVVAEGAIRKWAFPGQQQLVYLAKDILALGIYGGFIASGRHARRVRVPAPIFVPLIACALLGALEVFNPKLPGILVGVFGWKAYFWYAPLLWVVPAAFRDLADLDRFLRNYSLLVVPMVALGLIQFRSPTTSVLNRYAWGDDDGIGRVATFGAQSAARVTGTFTYISGYTTFLIAVGVFLLIVLGLRGFRSRGTWKEWTALLALPIGILVSGSRGPVVLLGGIFPLFFILARRGTGERASAMMRLLAGTAVAATLASFVALPALEAYSFRVRTTGEDVVARALEPLVGPFRLLSESGVLGYGIGATHQAASTLVPGEVPGSWLDGLVAEAESSRIMIELGPIGALLHLMYRLAVVWLAFSIALGARLSRSRVVALGAGFFLLAHLPGAIVFNVYAGIYFWFFAGCAFLAAAEDREAASRRRTSEEVEAQIFGRSPTRLSAQ